MLTPDDELLDKVIEEIGTSRSAAHDEVSTADVPRLQELTVRMRDRISASEDQVQQAARQLMNDGKRLEQMRTVLKWLRLVGADRAGFGEHWEAERLADERKRYADTAVRRGMALVGKEDEVEP